MADGEMAAMRRIERATEQSDPATAMLTAGAVAKLGKLAQGRN
jgi:hypothetical protein